MAAGQWITYPISSTVVAKGLCQQDRKMKLLKLLELPPVFGMATDYTKALKGVSPKKPQASGQQEWQ